MRLARAAAGAAAAIFIFAACAADETPEVQPPVETQEDAEASPAAPEDATVQAVDSEHGMILADADGRTLYVFLNDEGDESTCYDSCAETWPPLVVEGEPGAGPGVDAELGTSERRDGSQQVTIDGSPLYHYAADQEPGDTNGQGVGDRWFVVAPDGSPVQE